MSRRNAIIFSLLLTSWPLNAALSLDNDIWGQLKRPSQQRAESIGFYSSGCVAGAETLPLLGTGFQVMRAQRNRFYGHPTLVALIKRLGRKAAQQGKRFLIGDMSQPRGGPMSFGHRSHQIGLDADIWFRYIDAADRLAHEDVRELPMQSVADKKRGRLNSRWRPFYRDALQWVAESPEVARVFVNPVIKQALCLEPANHSWLRKIRPWWGHDGHFHVRLHCPRGNNQCRGQKSIPPGSGCGPDLDQWVEDQKSPKPKKWRPPKPVVLPDRCQSVLTFRAR